MFTWIEVTCSLTKFGLFLTKKYMYSCILGKVTAESKISIIYFLFVYSFDDLTNVSNGENVNSKFLIVGALTFY